MILAIVITSPQPWSHHTSTSSAIGHKSATAKWTETRAQPEEAPHAAKKKNLEGNHRGLRRLQNHRRCVYASYEIGCTTLCCSERRPLVVTSNSYGPLFGQERFSNGCNVGKTIGDQKAERQNYRVERGQSWNKITIHLYINGGCCYCSTNWCGNIGSFKKLRSFRTCPWQKRIESQSNHVSQVSNWIVWNIKRSQGGGLYFDY